MLRLAPPNPKRLGQSRTLKTSYGGAESNVAANLVRLGKNTVWFSLLPNNPLGWQCAAEIGQHGVDTSTIGWVDDARMGLYFVEYGQTPRPIRVWYDRANSAASQITQDDLPQQAIQDARWIHLTGITPALSESCRQAVDYAQNMAREAGKTVSFLPQLEIIPVGGVTLDSAADFIRKGARCPRRWQQPGQSKTSG